MSFFSSSGSPTCTEGRFSSAPSSNPADASTLAPPMPSRPVDDPSSTARFPAPRARATRAGRAEQAQAQHVDERVLPVAVVEHDLAADGRHPDGVAVATDPRHDALEQVPRARVVEGTEPERVHERDRARPIEKMSRMIPPTPVAAPWYGSTADGWLWLSMRSATARPSPTSTTRRPPPADEHPRRLGGQVAQMRRDDL